MAACQFFYCELRGGLTLLSLTTILALLATASLVGAFARRLGIPYATGLVVTAFLLGSWGLLPQLALDSTVVLHLFLPVLLFETAIRIDVALLRRSFESVFLLSTVGVVVMTGTTGVVLHATLGFDWPIALLMGNMLSITDTVAILAAFKELKVPQRLGTLIEGESLLNDGTALVLFGLLLNWTLSGHFDPLKSALDLVWVIVAGGIIGGVVGILTSLALLQTRDHLTEIMLSTLLALGSYHVAEEFHASGVISVVTAGLVFGNYGWRRALAPSSQVALGSFWEYAGFGVTTVVFLLVGLNVNSVQWVQYLPVILISFAAVQLGRASLIYPVFWVLGRFGREQVPLNWQHLMQLGNIKGSLTMVLAASLPMQLPGYRDLVTVMFGVVMLSLLVQGITLAPVIRRLGLATPSSLRQRFEREQLRLITGRAVQQELVTLYESGILSNSNFERLRARTQVSIAGAERELRRLGTEFQGHWDDVLQEIGQRLKHVEKSAVLNAIRQDLVSYEVAQEYLEQLDSQMGEQKV